MPQSFVKDPDSTLDYKVDWSDWLGADTISTSTWEIFPSGLTEESDAKTNTDATIWVSGGVAGRTYELTNRIVTANGRTVDRTIYVAVEER